MPQGDEDDIFARFPFQHHGADGVLVVDDDEEVPQVGGGGGGGGGALAAAAHPAAAAGAVALAEDPVVEPIPAAPGYVYVVTGELAQMVKIGFAQNFETRMRAGKYMYLASPGAYFPLSLLTFSSPPDTFFTGRTWIPDLKAEFIGFCADMRDAKNRVHDALAGSVRRRRDGGRATEWFLCTAEVARTAVITACCIVNAAHLSSVLGSTSQFVTQIMVGQKPLLEYTQRPGDANEGYAIQKMRLGNV